MGSVAVRAKFRCHSVKKQDNSWRGKAKDDKPFLYTVVMQPVSDGSPENKTFWEATPTGQLEMGSILPDAFEVGKEYYLDFTPAN